MIARFPRPLSVRLSLTVEWGKCGEGEHRAERPIDYLYDLEHVKNGLSSRLNIDSVPSDQWPSVCEQCAEPVPSNANRSTHIGVLYDTDTGSPEPGDLYYSYHEPGKCSYWDNCTGAHLIAVLPSGEHWDIDSQASNCTMPNNRQHRCWVRHGEPPAITVDKQGVTCQAGAGSIAMTRYHGFLKGGVFSEA
jgi:hypothetical protein